MKHTYRFPLFRAMDGGAVERYLERKAAKGLHLETAGSFLWKFRRQEPAHLTYAVTYFPQASLYGGPPNRAQRELAEFCAAAGWTYVTQWHLMQIYGTDRSDPVPLETEASQKLDLIRAVFRKGLPYDLLFLLAMTAQLLLMGNLLSDALTYAPARLLSSPASVSAGIFLILMLLALLLSAAELLRTACWLVRARRRLKRGYPCPDSSRRFSQILWTGVNALLLLLTGSLLLQMLFSSSPGQLLKFLVFLAILVLIRLVILPYLQKKGYQDSQILKQLLAVGVCAGLLLAAAENVFRPKFQEIPPAWYYTSEESGIRYSIYEDPLSLTLADLGVDTGDLPYSRFSRNNSASFLLSRETGEERCPAEEDFSGKSPYLSYELLRISFSPAYDLCRDSLLQPELAPVTDPRWQAERVYSGVLWGDTPALLICWERVLLFLTSSLIPDLTDAQIRTITRWACP